MSDSQQDPSWWQASDGKWYPPQQASPPPAPPPPAASPPIPPPAAQPFAAPQVYGAAPSGLPSVNGQAVASMVLGIVALVFCWCWPVGGACALVGLPLGAVALNKIKNGQADPKPRSMAIAGLVMSIIAIVLIIIILVLAANADTTYEFNN